MDMQSESITNIGEVYTNTLNTIDSYALGTSIIHNMEINGTLTFGPGAMIIVDGELMTPREFRGSAESVNINRDLIMNKLEKENDRLRSEMSVLKDRLEYLEKFIQL